MRLARSRADVEARSLWAAVHTVEALAPWAIEPFRPERREACTLWAARWLRPDAPEGFQMLHPLRSHAGRLWLLLLLLLLLLIFLGALHLILLPDMSFFVEVQTLPSA